VPAPPEAAGPGTRGRFTGGYRKAAEPVQPISATPGYPVALRLVAPAALPRRRLSTVAGRIALLHAVAHIEFNAINLAWDAVHRFRGLPQAFYRDWAGVAADETRHYQMLRDRLAALGAAYGDLPAHNGLWQMAVDTADDLVARMALVPRLLEARGLDVTPGMIERLSAAGDTPSAAALRVILEEEVAHVAVGTRWFHFACEARQLDPEATFEKLLGACRAGQLRGPFNHPARRAAGFSERELAFIEAEAARARR